MQNLKCVFGDKVQVSDTCYKKIQQLKRKYASVGYALFYRGNGEVEFQGWGRVVYTCKGKRV